LSDEISPDFSADMKHWSNYISVVTYLSNTCNTGV